MKSEFKTHSGGGDTTVIGAGDLLPLPPLKTPWIYSGPEQKDLSRALAAPLADGGGYTLSHEVMRDNGLILGMPERTEIEGAHTTISALNRMQYFLLTHTEATGVFFVSLEKYVDFRRHAEETGLHYDWRRGFISQQPPAAGDQPALEEN